jgi:hypothetical protein
VGWVDTNPYGRCRPMVFQQFHMVRDNTWLFNIDHFHHWLFLAEIKSIGGFMKIRAVLSCTAILIAIIVCDTSPFFRTAAQKQCGGPGETYPPEVDVCIPQPPPSTNCQFDNVSLYLLSSTISANIAQLSIHGCKLRSNLRKKSKAAVGNRLRIETPPEAR